MRIDKIKIEGMSCLHCVKAVKDELNKLPVETSKVEIGSAEVEYDENKVDKKMLQDAIAKAGYKAIG